MKLAPYIISRYLDKASKHTLGENVPGKSIQELQVGDSAETVRTVTVEDVTMFAQATGDFNPVHLDEEYAKTTMFRTRIAHGLLSAGIVSAVLAEKLPGPGTVYISQTLKFLAPVRLGDTVTARVEITALDPEKNRATLDTSCSNQDGTVVIAGQAVVMPPRALKA
jgi:3-hydroxybutyryl-CoA dehydratase